MWEGGRNEARGGSDVEMKKGRKEGRKGSKKGRKRGRKVERKEEERKEEREGLTFWHFPDCFLELFLFDLVLG